MLKWCDKGTSFDCNIFIIENNAKTKETKLPSTNYLHHSYNENPLFTLSSKEILMWKKEEHESDK